MGAGIQPGVAAAHDLHAELAALQIGAVDVGDLQLAARRRLQVPGDVHHLLVVEIQAGDRVVRLRLQWLLFQADGLAALVELDHAVALRVQHVVGEDAGAGLALRSAAEQLVEVVAVIEVVAQDQRAEVVADERLADQEGLGQAVRRRLHGILQVQAPVRTVAQQLLEAWGVLWGRDDQYLADARQHQGTERVVDHRLVVHRQQLLGDGQRCRVQAGARASGEDDALAFHSGPCSLSSWIMRPAW